MADVVDKRTRSRMMAGIRGRDTRPERILRSALHRLGLRYRLHSRGLPGRPDLVFPRFKAVVFVHGCFWHRHEGCRFATTPATNSAFWKAKFDGNVSRDARNIQALLKGGWRVAVIWECSLRADDVRQLGKALESWLHSASPRFERPRPKARGRANPIKFRRRK